MEVGTETEVGRSTDGQTAGASGSETDPASTCQQEKRRDGGRSESPSLNQGEMLRVLATVEKDSVAIAESFSSLFASLRLALSEATGSSVDHMRCFGDAAGQLQETALDATTKGNRYINSCLRLNEEIKGIENLAAQLKFLRRNVDALDTAVDKLLRPP